MLDLDTTLLRSFLILAETQSFTRTAEKVGRSQSAISMQIARLEDLLGCQLVRRTKRSVRLTVDGERLLEPARRIIHHSDALINRFREPEIFGELRFGSPEDFATSYLPEILARFTEAYPSVSLHVNCDLTLRLIEDFEKDRYDLIVIKQEPESLYPGAQSLWRERLVWVGGPHLPRDTGCEDVLSGNRALPLVLSPPPCVYRARATSALDESGISWDIAYTSPSITGMTAAVRAGLGYAVLPRKMVPPDLTPLEEHNGWPVLKEAEICLLARPDPAAPLQALSEFISARISFNQ